MFYEAGKADNLYVEELQQIVAARKQEYSLDSARAKIHAIVSRDSETAPDPSTTASSPPLGTVVASSEPLRLCSDLQLVHNNPRPPRFSLVDNEDEVQVVWFALHPKNFPVSTTNEQIQIDNQFPNEKVLTCKDLLCGMCKLDVPVAPKLSLQRCLLTM